jgi:iron complex outermembrane receptor protein
MKNWVILFAIFSFFKFSLAQEVVKLNPICLTKRLDFFYKLGFTNLEEVTKDEIDIVSKQVINELVGDKIGVDLKTRGPFNIQEDLYIRGTGFEQNLVMVDGISLNDPQTGHFNLDLPLTVYDLDKIQILRGVNSSFFGSNAVGGAINFVTTFPVKNNFKIKTLYGQNQLKFTNFALNKISKFLNFHLSYENSSASAARQDTDFKTQTIFTKWILNDFQGSPSLTFALNKKDFGADSFYSSNYPQEEEHTRTNLYILSFDFKKPKAQFSPKFYYRRHNDKFILDRSRPDWYKNIHTNHLIGLNLPFGFDLEKVRLNLGIEISKQDIKSTNLGKHSRNKISGYIGVLSEYFKKFVFSLNLRMDDYSNSDRELNLGIYLGYNINSEKRIFLSLQRGFRIPSFTELYYSSPANKGNPDLSEEKYSNIEIGYLRKDKDNSYGFSLFRRFGSDIIDWVKNDLSSAWQAENISYLKTDGLETWLKIKGLKFSYSYLDTDYKTSANYSKYIANYMKHKFSLSKNFKFKNYFLSFGLSYQERHNRSGFFNLDLGIKKKIKFKNYKLTSFLNIDNLTNSNQEEIDGVSLPDRWIYAGFKLEF